MYFITDLQYLLTHTFSTSYGIRRALAFYELWLPLLYVMMSWSCNLINNYLDCRNFSSRCFCLKVFFLNILLSRRESLTSFSCRKLATPPPRHLCGGGGIARKYLKLCQNTQKSAGTYQRGRQFKAGTVRFVERAKSGKFLSSHHGNRNRSAHWTGVRY